MCYSQTFALHTPMGIVAELEDVAAERRIRMAIAAALLRGPKETSGLKTGCSVRILGAERSFGCKATLFASSSAERLKSPLCFASSGSDPAAIALPSLMRGVPHRGLGPVCGPRRHLLLHFASVGETYESHRLSKFTHAAGRGAFEVYIIPSVPEVQTEALVD